MKTVFSTEKTFAPLEITDVYGASADLFHEIRTQHPEFETLWWSYTVTRYADNSAQVEIKVIDRDAPDPKENAKVFIAILIVGLILFLGLAFL